MDDSEIFSITNDAPLEDGDIGALVPREVIKVIGVGGAGGNALNTIIRSGIDDVDFIAGNTDVAALRLSEASSKLSSPVISPCSLLRSVTVPMT